MHTFTVTFTDAHSHQVQFVSIVAYNRQTALWLITSNQVCQAQIATILNAGDDLTAVVHQTA